MALKKLCNKPGCRKLAIPPHRYCEDHLELETERVNYFAGMSSNEYDYLYRSKKWSNASKKFLEENPYCCMCGMPSQVTDHITPHRGDVSLFWDEFNWQPLCKKCHDSKTRREMNDRMKANRRDPNKLWY